MATCRKCHKEFSKKIIVDGKKRNLQNRIYCLECSPFGSRNRRKLHEKDSDGYELANCDVCGKAYQYKRSDRRGHSRHQCNSCRVNIRRFHIKQRAIEYKGGKCERCGYSKCSAALEFHHKDRGDKLFNISANHSRSWDKIKEELDKCIMVCSRCHAEIEDEILEKTNPIRAYLRRKSER